MWLSLLTHQITQLQRELILQGISLGFPHMAVASKPPSREILLFQSIPSAVLPGALAKGTFHLNTALFFLWRHLWFAVDLLVFPSPLLSVSPSEAFPAPPSPAAHLGEGSGRAAPAWSWGETTPGTNQRRIWSEITSKADKKPIFERIFLMPVQRLASAPLKILIQVKCAGTEFELQRRNPFPEIQEKPVFFAQKASSGPQLCFDVCDSQQHLTAYFRLFEIVYIALDSSIRRRKYTSVAEKIHTLHVPFLPHLHTKQIFASPCSRNCFYYIWCPSSTVWFIPELLSTELALINQTTLMEKWENETGLVTAVIFSNPGISHISLKDSFQNQKKNLENASKSELLLKSFFTPEYQTTAVSLLNP